MHIDVLTRSKEYRVEWLDNLTALSDEIRKNIPNSYIVMVDENVQKEYSDFLAQTFDADKILPVAEGETSKTLKNAEFFLEEFLKHGLDRKSIVYAIGGGVTGDLAGFCASIYMRGIDFIQIPTTLLAMVDSSVGGKTGVNLKGGKNMVGSFHQPAAVLIAIDFLSTLPQKEIRCGLAEAIKTALIQKHLFFRYLEDHVPAILNLEKYVMQQISYEAIKVKAHVVEKDEKEKNLRAILNFGHTLAHGIEAALSYKKLTHGEAVAIGMDFAAFYSVRQNYMEERDYKRIYELFDALSLDRSRLLRGFNISPEQILDYILHDKKNRDGKIHFVFLDSIGHARLPEEVDTNDFLNALKEYLQIK
ncbi:MAG: 3-dehydroquinate synthase [Candidatus Hydrogenedentota bacterium]|nr:MAG: 3-dehydroquinate synthase [Candidatus Hydrogenedentota bacterium]